MDVAIIIAIIAAGVSALGVGITLIVFVVRGGFLLGRLVTRVEGLTASVDQLRADVQQSNQTLAALANHTHDTDGLTVFQVPPGANR